MRSYLQEIYDSRKEFDILTKSRCFGVSNPFYKVKRFISKGISPIYIENYLDNLKDLTIKKVDYKGYKSDYDYLTNTIFTSDSKSDIFGLLHVASNDREKEYTGIITKEGIGYGLNNGLTELFTHTINHKKIVYPIEVLISKILLTTKNKEICYSYFNNDSGSLINNEIIFEILNFTDIYHNNYIELSSLYRQKFSKEFAYHNQIYGKKLKEKDHELGEINDRIYTLEYINIEVLYNIIDKLINLISNSNLPQEQQVNILKILTNNLNKIVIKDNFRYLQELTEDFDERFQVKKLLK